MNRRPTRLQLRGSGTGYIFEPYRKVVGAVDRARENGRDVVKLDGRVYRLSRIDSVIAPDQDEAA